MLGSYLLYSGT